MKDKDLVQIIKDNPGCVAIIDNDNWHLKKANYYPEDFDDWTWEEQEVWEQEHELARDGEVKEIGDGGYGTGNCYGGDILQALAQIVGIKIESV